MRKSKLSTDFIVSMSAIVIAVVSIIITLWQGIETRRHNRLSVQPRLDISYELDYGDSLAQLRIRNNGLGPAIIEEARAIINTTEYKLSDIDDFLGAIGIHDIPFTYDRIDNGSTIVPNDTKTIFSTRIGNLEKQDLNPFELLDNCKIVVDYESLYEEEFTVKNTP